jgi:hypothetical protein
MIKVTEADIQKAILQYLAVKHIFHFRNNTGATKTERGGFVRFGTPGSPDIIVVDKGIFIGIEVKRPGGKLSPHQKAFCDALLQAGGRYVVAQSLEDVMEIL